MQIMNSKRLLILLFSLVMLAYFGTEFFPEPIKSFLPIAMIFSWILHFILVPFEAKSQGRSMPLWGALAFLFAPFSGLAIVFLGEKETEMSKNKNIALIALLLVITLLFGFSDFKGIADVLTLQGSFLGAGGTGPCSNANYSTEMAETFDAPEGKIFLTDVSKEKLRNALETEGKSALYDISDLTCLEYLDLSGSVITNVGALNKLTDLKDLLLGASDVSNIEGLRGMKKLEYLDLGLTDVSDITPIEDLENLKYVNLEETDVHDISALQNLTKLERIDLSNTNVSSEDCTALEELFPEATIYCP